MWLFKNSLETDIVLLTSDFYLCPSPLLFFFFFFFITKQHENPYLLPVLEFFSYFLKVNILQLISMSGNQPLQHCKWFFKTARLDVLITSKYNSPRKYMFISAPGIFRMQTETKQSEKVTRKITMLSISFSLPHFLKTGMKSSKASWKGAKNNVLLRVSLNIFWLILRKMNPMYNLTLQTQTTKILHHNNHQKSFLNVCYGHFFTTNWKDMIAASNGAIFSSHKALGTMPST